MLGFIQRYQKVLFGVFAVLISISFLFFGMLPKGAQKLPDKVVYQTHNKQKIKQSKFEGLKILLNTNNGEYSIYGPALGQHFFTENFLVSDILKPGILALIMEKNREALQEDLIAQHLKERSYKPYAHPSAPFLNAETIWSIHAPELKNSIEHLKSENQLDKVFEQRQKLYLEESKFPSFNLWQVLSEQEEQFDWIPKDSNLNPQRLNLFGYQSLEDWFGEKLIKKTCEFICEVNAIAKERGYKVSIQEAEQDLMQLNEQNFMRIKSLGIEDFADSQAYLETKLRHLGLGKVQLVSLWRELLLFRKIFQEAGQSILLDSFSMESFENHANERVRVCRYQLPEDLQLKTPKEWMQLEVYLEALGKPISKLSLDFKERSAEEVSDKYPQLVERPIQLQYKEVSLANAALTIKVQDIWKWKLDQSNYAKLTKKFPKLSLSTQYDSENFQNLLENLDTVTQMQVDQYVRETLLKENADWIEKALSLTQLTELQLAVRKNGQGLPFKGLELYEQKDDFLAQFFKGLCQSECSILKNPITFDGQHYYQLIALQEQGPDQLVSYLQLKNDRTLEKLLYKRLNEFAGQDLSFEKELSSAQKKVAKELFEPLKKEIKNDYLVVHKDGQEEFADEFYCKYRFYHSMRRALDFMKEHSKLENSFILTSQWNLKEVPHTYVRYLSSDQEMEALLSLKEGQWTPVESFENNLEFFHILHKPKAGHEHVMQKQIKKKASQELTQALAREVLNII